MGQRSQDSACTQGHRPEARHESPQPPPPPHARAGMDPGQAVEARFPWLNRARHAQQTNCSLSGTQAPPLQPKPDIGRTQGTLLGIRMLVQQQEGGPDLAVVPPAPPTAQVDPHPAKAGPHHKHGGAGPMRAAGSYTAPGWARGCTQSSVFTMSQTHATNRSNVCQGATKPTSTCSRARPCARLHPTPWATRRCQPLPCAGRGVGTEPKGSSVPGQRPTADLP